MAKFGLDQVIAQDFAQFKGQSIALVCNQASIASDYVHVLDHLLKPHKEGRLKIASVFGPQHGVWGHTQDNMIEWEGYKDPRTGIPVWSLYGETREPTDDMLSGTDRLVFDVPDVGARYYTFIWTLALCMKACSRLKVPVTVLDRPNPIGGAQVEGTLLDPAFASFVGLYPLPTRHGMTVGEIGLSLRERFFPECQLDVIQIADWDRGAYLDETGLPWAMPSPNMPTVDTAVVYPGMCLLEGTQLSEGRGTTRPFELFGAPYIDGWALTERLNGIGLQGVVFRPGQFQPTFQKFRDEVCQGAFLHVTDRRSFKPVLTAVAVLQEVVRQRPADFKWLVPPYEYEHEKRPIDILAGNDWLAPAIESLEPLDRIEGRFADECAPFLPHREAQLLYTTA